MARATISPNFSGGAGPVDNIVQHPGHCDTNGASTGGFNSSGDSTVSTDYGFIRTAARAVGSLNASGYGQNRDSLTLTIPGQPIGTTAVVTYALEVRGRLLADSGASGASWTLGTDIGGGAYDLHVTRNVYAPDLGSGQTGPQFGVQTAVGSLQVGIAGPLFIEFAGGAQAANSGNGSGHAGCDDLKCWWNGIVSVTVNGAPITNYTITSASGTDWTHGNILCRADFGQQGGLPGGDGLLDNNDFVVFINNFFAQDPSADIGVQGGLPGSDGLFDNNDFIVFIDLFFSGC